MHSPMTRHAKRHFTLIELLVVVVIVTVLFAALMPAFNRMMTGNAVSYGARIISSQLNMARIEACRSRRNVAVVFADAGTEGATYPSGDGVVLNKRAFRSCYVSDDLKTFEGWIPGTKWEVLPVGAYLDFGKDGGEECFVGSDLDASAFEEITKEIDGENKIPKPLDDEVRPAFVLVKNKPPKHVILFKRSGKPLSADKTLMVTVREGVVVGNDLGDDHKPDKYDQDNYLQIKVNRYTGNVFTAKRQ